MLLDEMRAKLKEFEQKDEDCAEYDGIYIGTSEATKELRDLLREVEGNAQFFRGSKAQKKIEWVMIRKFEAWKKKHCGVSE